ncbi:MAG: hypothetical protein AAF658_14920 [Myxococcota bacterium]
MSEDKSKAVDDFFAAGALVGKPIEDAGMSRSQVDGLDFSTARSRRPSNMSRDEYMSARPGRNTKIMLREAGIERRQKSSVAVYVIAGLAVLGVVVGLVLWLT